ncbi:MAG: AAA family ATPase [Gemmatimonadota bacterium]|nr:AAA family ATPase [Gemmatimonadota bacterium]
MLLRTLGTFDVVERAGPESGDRLLGPRKPLALLLYLALRPGQRATRDHLIDLLWGKADPERARATLRQTVWALRQRLGAEALSMADGVVGLHADLAIDCVQFERAVGDGRYTDALELYGGDFLPDFAVAGGDEFDRWADRERQRLRLKWITAMDASVRAHLAAGRMVQAIAEARRLRDADPGRAVHWRLLIDALLLHGDRVDARAEADALRIRLASEGGMERAPDPAFDALLHRLEERAGGTTTTPAVSSPAISPDPASSGDEPTPQGPLAGALVGREEILRSVLDAWRQARRGQGRVMLVRGVAGLGKTRLLDHARDLLVSNAAGLVSVRARSGDRDIAYAFVAALAERLAEFPGALGVSPASAAALVEIAPVLSNTFRGASTVERSGADALRVRSLALHELVRVVADETPLAIVVDDLHWVDEASRTVLASLVERLAESPVLLLLASRPLRRLEFSIAHGSVVELPHLDGADLVRWMESIATLPADRESSWGRALFRASGGVPLLATVSLALSMQRGLLSITHGTWQAHDDAALLRLWHQGRVLDDLLRALPDDGMAVLLAAALAGTPLPQALLERMVVHGSVDGSGRDVCDDLERRGVLVHGGGDLWEVAHDRIAETVLSSASPELRRDVARRLGHALLLGAAPEPRMLRLAGRLLSSAGDRAARQAFRRWLVVEGRRGWWRDPVAAAEAFLGRDATETTIESVRALAVEVRPFEPWWRGTTWVRPLARLAGAAVVLVGVAAFALRTPAARTLALREPAHSAGFLWPPDDAGRGTPAPIAIPLDAELLDQRGARTSRGPATATVSLVVQKGVLALRGTRTRPVAAGSVRFTDLALDGSGAFQLEVRAGTLPPVRTRLLYAIHDAVNPVVLHAIHLQSGTLNAQAVDRSHRTVRVSPGAVIDGALVLRTITAYRTSAMLLGAVAQWGDRTSNWLALDTPPSHGDQVRTVPLRDAVTERRLVAPTRPGRYRILIVAAPETEMKYIASRTNWALANPVWNDGDDLADLGPAQWAQLDTQGWLLWPRVIAVAPSERARYRGQRARREQRTTILGTTIEIEVTAGG